MILTVIFAGVMFILGLFGGIHIAKNPDEDTNPQSSRRSCYIRVMATDDPSIYRAVYTMNERTRYNVTGRGISNTLQNMIEEIEGV